MSRAGQRCLQSRAAVRSSSAASPAARDKGELMDNHEGEPLRRSTLSDVARLAGVSPKTVSRVVNNVATVNSELADRVRKASAELEFRPNTLAADLRLGRTHKTIAILIKDISNPIYATIAAGAADVARGHGAQLITAHTGEHADEDLAVIEDLCRRRVDGLLVVPSGGYTASATEPGVPTVFLDRSLEGVDADSVTVDNTSGAERGVETLIKAGHQRIGIIVDTLSMQTMSERLRGARTALRQADLPCPTELVAAETPDEAQAAQAVEHMLRLTNPPTAFFCGNNRLALGTLGHLWDRREDQAIVGFDDIPGARLLPLPITCVGWAARELGALGASLLFRRIAGDRSGPSHIVLPTRLIKYPGIGVAVQRQTSPGSNTS